MTLDLEEIYYPWNRTFEIGFITPVTFPTEPYPTGEEDCHD